MAMPTPELKSQIDLASEAARAAGRALAERVPDWTNVRSETAKDVKLAADVNAETIILDLLSARSPYPILAEEKGWIGAPGDICWVVDRRDL